MSWHINICPHCDQPTYFGRDGQQTPAPVYGYSVKHVPDSVGTLYDEARRCMSVSAYTSAVLACRKVLMAIAVDQGAPENQSFFTYVEFLAQQGYIPPNGRHWVDHIRQRGNEATHEIQPMLREDAERLIDFTAGLLRFNYEFPAILPAPPTQAADEQRERVAKA